MQQNKKILLFFLPVLILTSCFKSYEPVIITSDVNKLVVSGQMTNLGGNQSVSVSMASSINKPEEIPVKGCTVTISDDQGHQFPLADSDNGTYHGWIDSKYLTVGSSFMVEVLMPDGSKIVSDFDKFSTCPKVDSVYYTRKDIPTSDPINPSKGIQFYVDLNGENTDSRYYRWEALETWEYHADYPIEWYYDTKVRHLIPPDYSKDTCWTTVLVRNIYAISTEHLALNKSPMIPLNFVDNTTSRLLYGYSLLVTQYALSETAYKYWKQLQTNSTYEGGLYERQPLATKGNMHNLTHPDQDVLGFFGTASVNSKRIFVSKVENLEIEYLSTCMAAPMSKYGFSDYVNFPKPIYLMAGENTWLPIILYPQCVDCTTSFGKNVKPDFWPN